MLMKDARLRSLETKIPCLPIEIVAQASSHSSQSSPIWGWNDRVRSDFSSVHFPPDVFSAHPNYGGEDGICSRNWNRASKQCQ